MLPPILPDRPVSKRAQKRHLPVRVQLFFFVMFVAFSLILFRLAEMQLVQGREYVAKENQNANRPVRIAPVRGNIFDVGGAPLASTESVQSLFYQYVPRQKPEEMIALAKRLETILAQYGETGQSGAEPAAAEILKSMDVGIDLDGNETRKAGYIFQPRRIKFNLSEGEIAYFAEHRDELQGVEIAEESTRLYVSYDSKFVAPQLIGYVRPFKTVDNLSSAYLKPYRDRRDEYLNEEYIGFDGLEFLYQDELRGKMGEKTYPVNSKSEIIGDPVITPPEKGHNLNLTINKDVQLEAQQAIIDQLSFMKNAPYPHNLGAQAISGFAVALEVNSGRVAAMASYPDYDPNTWVGTVNQSKLDEVGHTYLNGAIRDRPPNIKNPKQAVNYPGSMVPLGSTMKPLTVLLGLNEGLISPNEGYYDSGIFVYGRDGSTIRNSSSTAYGALNPTTAIKVSSNTFMAEKIGNRLYMRGNKDGEKPLDTWDRYMKQFGLGVLTGSRLPGEDDGTRDYVTMAKNSSPQAALVFSSFGQGARYTTLQLAQYASMLANKGKRYRPQFIDRITTYDGTQISKPEPELLDEVKFPDQYWDIVEKGMLEVGVGGIFDQSPYTVARKTGTSQQDVGARQKIENAVFIAYAPAENPKLAVAVVVPDGGYGAYGAAPIAKRIFDAYDKHVGLSSNR